MTSSRWNHLLFIVLIAIANFSSKANASLFGNLLDAIEDTTGLDFGGGEEEEAAATQDEPRYYTEDPLANALMMVDFVDTPLYLVALFQYRDTAIYEDGRSVEADFTGFDADSIYTRAMFSDIVPGVGGEAKYVANIQNRVSVVETLNPEEFDTVAWNALAVIEFPSGIAFGKMLANQRFQDLTVHKKAGLEYHAIFACELVSGSAMEEDFDENDMGTTSTFSRSSNTTRSRSTGNATIGREETQEDVPVSVVDLVDYKRYASYKSASSAFEPGPKAASKYYDAVTPIEMEYGMRTASIFKIKHYLIEGAEGWDEVRINTYPSQESMVAAKKAVAESGSDRLAHLQAGANRVQAMELAPVFFNSLGGIDQIGYDEACDSEEQVSLAGSAEHDLSALCP